MRNKPKTLVDNILLNGKLPPQAIEISPTIIVGDYELYLLEDEIKPILRPLSDLTKELYFELSGKSEKLDFGFWYGKHNGDFDKRDYIYHTGYSGKTYYISDGCGQYPYKMMLFFFEHRFDIFGLINEGLAISIHDV